MDKKSKCHHSFILYFEFTILAMIYLYCVILLRIIDISKFDFVSFILILVVHLLKSENHSTSIMLSHVITFTKMTAVIILPLGQPFFYKICVSPLIRISWDNPIEKHAVIVQHHNLDITYTSISIFYYPTSIHLFILNRIHPGSWILHIIM